MADNVDVVDKVDLLARIPLFAGLGSDELERIAALTEEVEVAAGTVLTHEGRYEGWFYLVVAGTVEIARAGAAVDTVGAGGFVGEISLIDAGPRTATVTTLTPCELLRVDNRHFDALVESSPAIRQRLQEAMETRLEQMDAETE
jgi:CRP/FNR family cyclic AMP-dependent transcriptional regulator